MSAPETVDAQVVDEPGTALEPAEPQSSVTLFRTDDPVEVVERASRVADALRGVLDKQGLTAKISGKQHVLVEGWTTLGAMVGVTAVPAWTKPLPGDAPTGKTFGYEARVEARTLDGRVIGAAEAMCTRAEGRWKTADDYAIRSMAQTRATSKALRGPLGFVVTLAGYESTPAEEIPADTPPAEPMVTREQYQQIVTEFGKVNTPKIGALAKLAKFLGVDPTPAAIAEYATPEAGRLTAKRADETIRFLQGLAA